MPNDDHLHIWGELERSHFAGTSHRKCQVDGCDFINALDDDPHPFFGPGDEGECTSCGVLEEHHPVYTDEELDEAYG